MTLRSFDCPNLITGWYLYYYFKYPSGDYLSHQLMDFKADKENQLKTFSQLAAEAFGETDWTFDYVVRALGSKEITPTKPNRVREVAKAIADRMHATYIPELLKKNKATKAFKGGLSRQSRIEQMEDVYEINVEYELNDKSVLIVDDISTTGTTFEVIAGVIKAKYPKARIYGFSLAKTTYKIKGELEGNLKEDIEEYKIELEQNTDVKPKQ